MDNTTRHLLILSAQLAAATNRSLSTISRLATGSGETLARLERGHDITTRRAARFGQWFSDHWPSGTPWPSDIPRPAASASGKEAA